MTTRTQLRPQEWWEVMTPPAELAQQAAALVPGEGMLTLDQLETLVAEIVRRPDLWKPLTIQDTDRRRYRLLFENEQVDIWVLSWMSGQGTGFHDHDLSGVGLAVAQGEVIERQMLLPTGATRLQLKAGDTRQGAPGYIHSVAWGDGEPAVTIHAYSPPLIRVGQFKVDEAGILQRRIEHGRQELMDESIATVDPSRSDG